MLGVLVINATCKDERNSGNYDIVYGRDRGRGDTEVKCFLDLIFY